MNVGSEHTHHHGLLAGAKASAVAVAVIVPLLFWMVWHQIASTVGLAGKFIVWSLVVLWLVVVAYGIWYLLVRAVMHARQPETAMGRVTLRARTEVGQPVETPVLQSQSAPELPVGGSVVHNHFHGPEAVKETTRILDWSSGEPR